ncbi:MAG: DUF4249 domain-containing protein [Paludibacter sp.]
MKLIKIFFSILLCLFTFSSCQKNIEFNEEISKPMVVIHSILSPDSVVSAHVSLSRFFLNDTVSFQDVNNADVTVIVNGVLKEKMGLITNGQYQGTYRPAIGDMVKLVVNVPSMNEVSSQTSFCNPTVINYVDTTRIIQTTNYILLSNGDTCALEKIFKINYILKFTDNGNEKNYYRLIVQKKLHFFEFIWGKPIEKIIDLYNFEFNDNVIGNNPNANTVTSTITGKNTNTNSSNKYNVFSDDLFNGKTYSLSFNADYLLYKRYPKYSLDSGNTINSGGAAEKIEVFISLQNISKDYYYYLKSRSASSGNDFFSEPVQIKNNIVGGIGFFGSYTSSNIVKFDLK